VRRARGGLEAEREARAAFHERQMAMEKQRLEAMREIREAGWRKVRGRAKGWCRE